MLAVRWEIENKVGRYFSLVSPELSRGFSGKGRPWNAGDRRMQAALPHVTNALGWQSQIIRADQRKNGNERGGAIEAALAVLGARGLAGYDTSTGSYFHRVLPFDIEKVDQLQPRLKNARKLLDQVQIVRQQGADVDAKVPGSDFDEFVRLRFEGNKCTCRWHSRYQGQPGPCKHILAVRMKVEGADNVKLDDPEAAAPRCNTQVDVRLGGLVEISDAVGSVKGSEPSERAKGVAHDGTLGG